MVGVEGPEVGVGEYTTGGGFGFVGVGAIIGGIPVASGGVIQFGGGATFSHAKIRTGVRNARITSRNTNRDVMKEVYSKRGVFIHYPQAFAL